MMLTSHNSNAPDVVQYSSTCTPLELYRGCPPANVGMETLEFGSERLTAPDYLPAISGIGVVEPARQARTRSRREVSDLQHYKQHFSLYL